MIYHKFNFKRFSLLENLKILICRIFGHRIGATPTEQGCGRCGLAYEEAYYPENYYEKMQEWYDDLDKELD